MSTNQQELLQLQTSVENPHNSNSSNQPLIEREQIPNTPFWILGNTEQGYLLIMGNYQISPKCETKGEILHYLETHQWEISLTLATIVFTQLNQNNQQ